eukprot:5276757-Alexandrium_andersonii.AAC.1
MGAHFLSRVPEHWRERHRLILFSAPPSPAFVAPTSTAIASLAVASLALAAAPLSAFTWGDGGREEDPIV